MIAALGFVVCAVGFVVYAGHAAQHALDVEPSSVSAEFDRAMVVAFVFALVGAAFFGALVQRVFC